MNEAKQKALELCEVVNEKLGICLINSTSVSLAMISVDEILSLRLDFSHDDNIHPVNDFYKEVKEELIKLNNKNYREVCENELDCPYDFTSRCTMDRCDCKPKDNTK